MPVLLGLIACSEDKGNYSYDPVNVITIEGIRNSYNVVAESQLSIHPTLIMANDKEVDLTYKWEINGQELSTEKDLDIVLPPLSFGSQVMAYTVNDNKTGMKYIRTFNVGIVSPFNFGYYFLTEKPDETSEMVYVPARTDDEEQATEEDVIYASGCGELVFGAKPISITGSFSYLSALSDYYWTLQIMNAESNTPVIVTNNATFMPTTTITDQSYMDMDAGYKFIPEMVVTDLQGSAFYLSENKIIQSKAGTEMLYRPARNEGTYEWAYIIPPANSIGYLWAYDRLSKKFYLTEPLTSDASTGVVGDSYAYDNVVEITDSPELKGQIIGSAGIRESVDRIYVMTSDADGLHLYQYRYDESSSPALTEELAFPVGQVTNQTQAILVKDQDWMVSIGNMIYTIPLLNPRVSQWLNVPSEYGTICQLSASALQSRLVITTYDEASTAAHKGSVLFVDIQTKQITHVFKHVLDKCVSIFCANADGFGLGWEGYGDLK